MARPRGSWFSHGQDLQTWVKVWGRGWGAMGWERNHTLFPQWREGAPAHVSEGDTLEGWDITVNDPGPRLGSQRRNWVLAI